MNTMQAEIEESPSSAGVAAAELLQVQFRRNLGQVSRHSFVFFAGTFFTLGAGYGAKIYVARVLGAEQLGLYALGMTLVTLAQLLGTIGLNGAVARYVAIYNSTGKFEELRGFLTRSVGIVVSLNLIFSLALAFGGGLLARSLYRAPGLHRYMFLFALLAFLGSFNVFYCQILAGFKDVAKRTIITNFVGSSLVIILTVLLLASGVGMWGYLAAQIINSLIVVCLLVGLSRKLTPRAARFSLKPLPPLDPEVKTFVAATFGMSILEFLSSQADKILLGHQLNASLVGIYVLASTITAFIPIVLQSVNQIFAPIIADLHAQSRQDVLRKLFQTLTKWILALTFPLALVVIVFAVPLMTIFGSAFALGWPVLVIGSLGQLVNCGVGSVGYLLLMSGNQRRLIKVQFVMAGISLSMNIVLIPAFGIVGAALAAASVNIAGNLWNLAVVRKALGISPYNRSYFKLLIPGIATIAAVVFLRFQSIAIAHTWRLIPLAMFLSYILFGSLTVAFALDRDDRMLAQSAWSRLRISMYQPRDGVNF